MQPDVSGQANFPSFPRPVPLPTVDPDASPNKAITVSCQWLPYIRGALTQLVQQYTWPQADPAAVLLAQQRAMTLISLFEECSSSVLPFTCGGSVLGGSSSPFGTWTPHMGWATYSGAAGWQSVDFSSGGCYYRGCFVDVTLDNPATVGSWSIVYNCHKLDPVGACDDSVWAGIYDDDNAVFLPGAVGHAGVPLLGIDDTFTFGPGSAPSSHYRLVLICCQTDAPSSCDPADFFQVTSSTLTGTASIPPC